MSKWKNGPDGKTRKRKSLRIDGQFAGRPIEMLESPTFQALGLDEHRMLARIEIELAHHAGYDNGDLPVTYDQFIKYGVRRKYAANAINVLETFGFIRVKRGRGGNAEYRQPNKFGLTYRYTRIRLGDPIPATDDWRIKPLDQAVQIARQLKTESRPPSVHRARTPQCTSKTETSRTPQCTLQGQFPQGVYYLDSRVGGGEVAASLQLTAMASSTLRKPMPCSTGRARV